MNGLTAGDLDSCMYPLSRFLLIKSFSHWSSFPDLPYSGLKGGVFPSFRLII